MNTNNKQNLFNKLDGFISDLGYAEIRIDELLRDIDSADSAEICQLAAKVAAELAATVREFNANIKRLKLASKDD
jgi:hypothetical protein